MIDDDILVGDLNLQISLTHTHVSYLDCFLTGPDGCRIELFSGVGGHDDNFDNTVFDDQSRIQSIKRGHRSKGLFSPWLY